MRQRTIKKAASISGIGLHTGVSVSVTIKPAPTNHGYRFMRIDMEEKPYINAEIGKVSATNRGTTLKQGDAEVHTVEHLLSALRGLEVDNVLIEIDGVELPILDGSAQGFVDMIQAAGIEEQEEERVYFEITEPIVYKDEESGVEIVGLPAERFESLVLIDFNSPILGKQYASFDEYTHYENDIAPCRTFVFLRDVEELFERNLIKGGSLDNAIVIADKEVSPTAIEALAKKLGKSELQLSGKGILNTDLRADNEPARHKLLDLIGDTALLGIPIKGKIIATKPGHRVNVEFTKLLKAAYLRQQKFAHIPKYDPNQKAIMEVHEIAEWLPHRYPFLLIDKVIELTEDHVVCVKNVTVNEAFFQGHFPGNPVMPGVLQIEAMAQTGGILVLSMVEDPGNYDTYFLKISNAKFKAKVAPGDTLIFKVELTAPVRRGICQVKSSAYVGNTLVSEAEMVAQIVKRN